MKSSSWSIDVKSCTEQGLVDALRQLDGSEQSEQQLKIRTELVLRARNAGLTTSQIIDRLIFQVPPGRTRNNIAKEWALALQITVEEFKEMASGA